MRTAGFQLGEIAASLPAWATERDSVLKKKKTKKLSTFQDSIQGLSGSRLYSQHFGKLRQEGGFRPGVPDLPGQHSETPSLQKISWA